MCYVFAVIFFIVHARLFCTLHMWANLTAISKLKIQSLKPVGHLKMQYTFELLPPLDGNQCQILTPQVLHVIWLPVGSGYVRQSAVVQQKSNGDYISHCTDALMGFY